MSSPDYEAALRELYAVQSKLAEAETRIKTLEHLVSDDAAAEEWLSQRAKKAEKERDALKANLARVVEWLSDPSAHAEDCPTRVDNLAPYMSRTQCLCHVAPLLAAAKGEP